MDTTRRSCLLGNIGLAALITGCATNPGDSQGADQGGVQNSTSATAQPGEGQSSAAPSTSSDTTAPDGPGQPLPENGTDNPSDPCLAPKLLCNGECIHPDSNPRYCGASADCAPPNQGQNCAPGMVCSAGQCSQNCAPGEVRCGDECINPLTSRDYCGASLNCQGANAGSSCAANQVCAAGICTADCGADEINCNGECVNPKTDIRYCGAALDCKGSNVGSACASGQVCANGKCKLECDAGSIECKGECINPLNDNRYCGAKDSCSDDASDGEVCPTGSICSGGECEVQCDPGLVECEGRCIDPKSDNNFCGADASCNNASKCESGKSCVDGSCQVQCPAGKVKCNDQCIDPKSDNQHCGATADCLGTNAGSICSGDLQCVDGSCELQCDADEVECDAKCINPKSDEQFCGASADCKGSNTGQSCNASTHECIDGSCKPQCEPGKIACDDSCIDPQNDPNFCGAADPCDEVHNGEVCSDSERCIAGACTFYCSYPQINCGGTCVDPRESLSNCGAMGNCQGSNAGKACGSNEACVNGICELQCAADEIACDGRCVNPKADRDFCGADAACNGGQSCGDGFICSAGACERDCPPNEINCNDRCINPLSDNVYCGAAGNCEGGNAGQSCASLFHERCINGACELVCPAGQVACGGRCINPKNSQRHCGAKLDCSGANAGKTCQAPEQSCVNGSCEATGCGESEALARPEAVVIELVLDKSGSMVSTWDSNGEHETRWKSLHRAVLKLVDGYGPKNGKSGQAEFGALLFPARDAALPYDSKQTRNCAATNDRTRCVPTTDAWASANPYRSCKQPDGSRADCIRDPYAVDSGLAPAWAPNAGHTSAHFNSILPHADSQAMERSWNRFTYNDGNEANRMRRISGGTPTAQAMRSALTVLGNSRYDGRKRVSILISDGATTGTTYNRGSSGCDASRAEALERELYSLLRNAKRDQGIPTYVIGVDLRSSAQAGSGDGNCGSHTVNAREEANEMAKAGGTGNAMNVTDSVALNTAFNNILKDVMSCTINIGDAPPYINDVEVFFPDATDRTKKGKKVPSYWKLNACDSIPGGAAGWVYANSAKTQIELCNNACKDFKNRLTGELFVVKGCTGPE